jgi:cell division protein FtsW
MRFLTLRREIPILLPMVVLIGIGWVMVFSTAAVIGVESGHVAVFAHLKRQMIATAIGAFGLFVALRLPLAVLEGLAPRLLAAASALMLVVFVPGVGRSVARATRWISLGPVSFQPVELFKVAVVLAYARLLCAERPRAAWPLRTWGTLAALASLSLLLPILQRDFGSAALMLALAVGLLWLGGARMSALAAFGGAALAAAAVAFASAPYRLHRLQLYLAGFGHGGGAGYQTQQSLIALGSGGLRGVGLGESVQKLLYLPSAHADFIFAIIGEELGLVGALCTVGLYVLLLREGLSIAQGSSMRFARLLASGLTVLIFLQAVWHIAVSLVLVPTKGLALPFVSYGGSSLIASMTAIGLILRCADDGVVSPAPVTWVPVDQPGGRAWTPS